VICMEDTTPQSQETSAEKMKRWFQDNLRIIVSIIIVIAIAGGIYSYSKRSVDLTVTEEDSGEKIDLEESGTVEVTGEQSGQQTDEKIDSKKSETPTPESKETESSFIETATNGDGTTKMARRALANYLEKNTDSELTKEHKIYIEDYLRKNINFQEKVYPGTTVEFSKSLIQDAISQSKKLNEKQLQNLQKYSALVTSLP